MDPHDELIALLKRRVWDRAAGDRTGHYPGPPRPPLAPEKVEEGERRLGFRLPPLLRRLYLEVADGFWGPGFGLSPFLTGRPEVGEESVVDSMAVYPEIGWPSNLFPLCSWGCGFDSYVNYWEPDLPVIFEDIDYSDDCKGYVRWPSGYTLHRFLWTWGEGGDVALDLSTKPGEGAA